MAFRDFTFPEVQQMLGISLLQADLTTDLPALSPRADFAAQIQFGTILALDVDTEKARSEFIIAPVLLELRRSFGKMFGLFSGIEFNVDASRGLNGFCDFILTKSPMQLVLTAPLVAIVEAKNDNIRYGLGQCIASMVAAWEFNEKAGTSSGVIFGAVTTGSAWKFLQLKNKIEVTVDMQEYHIRELGKIMGILAHMVQGNASDIIKEGTL